MTVRNDALSLAMSLSLLMTSGAAMAGETRRHDLAPAEIEAIQGRVTANFREPDSARFRNLIAANLGSGEVLFCGEVNGKNAMGGYVGYQRFWGQGDGKITIADNAQVRKMTDLLCTVVEKVQ